MGRKGLIGLDGKQGPPGNNSECILGTESESLIGMLINLYITTTCTLKLYYIIICTRYCTIHVHYKLVKL